MFVFPLCSLMFLIIGERHRNTRLQWSEIRAEPICVILPNLRTGHSPLSDLFWQRTGTMEYLCVVYEMLWSMSCFPLTGNYVHMSPLIHICVCIYTCIYIHIYTWMNVSLLTTDLCLTAYPSSHPLLFDMKFQLPVLRLLYKPSSNLLPHPS